MLVRQAFASWAFVGVASYWIKLALRKNHRNLHAKFQISSFYSFQDPTVHTDGLNLGAQVEGQ